MAQQFVASFRFGKNNMILITSLCHWEQVTSSLRLVNYRPQLELCALLAVLFLIANKGSRWRWETLKVFHRMAGGRNL
jgi:hypothetical protein